TPLPTLLIVGLKRGFEHTESPEVGKQPNSDQYVIANGEAVNTLALSYLLRTGGRRPFFAWLHYYDAHRPYGPQGQVLGRRVREGRRPRHRRDGGLVPARGRGPRAAARRCAQRAAHEGPLRRRPRLPRRSARQALRPARPGRPSRGHDRAGGRGPRRV